MKCIINKLDDGILVRVYNGCVLNMMSWYSSDGIQTVQL